MQKGTRQKVVAKVFSKFFHKWQFILPLITLCYLPLSLFPHASYAYQTDTLENLKNISDITQDNQGFIWFTGRKGLSRYDNKGIINFSSNTPYWQVPFTWTHSLSKHDDKILVGTESHGLWEISPQTGKGESIPLIPKNRSVYNAIKFNNKYYAFAISPNAIYSFDPATNTTSLIKENTDLNDFFIFKERLFFYNHTGVYEITPSGVETFFYKNIEQVSVTKNKVMVMTKNSVIAITINKKSTSLPLNSAPQAITTANNLESIFIINQRGKVKHLNENLRRIKHNYTSNVDVTPQHLYHDSSGVLWVINSQGIQKLSQAYNVRHSKVFDTRTENSIEMARVNNALILGSYGAGLHDFDEESPFLAENINTNFTSKGLKIMDLQTVGDSVYIATFDGLWLYNSVKQTIRKLNIGNNQQILLKLAYKNRRLYIGTDENGFIIYNTFKHEIEAVVDDKVLFSSAEIIDLLPLSDDSVWLATAKGVDVYDSANKTISKISLPITSKVISLTQSHNKIFASTHGNGLFVFNKSKELLAHIAKDLSFTYIRAIKEQIWAPTSQGLYTLDPKDYQLTLVPNTEDLSFSSEAVLFDNKVYAAHYAGILEVPLAKAKFYNAQIHISKTTISGKTYIENKPIYVNSPNDVISFELSSSDHRSGKEKQFKYQINNSKWNNVNGNQLTLTGLASGTYNLNIEGTNSLGQWSNHQAFSQINVAYPWYWTPNMQVLYIVTLFSAFAMTFWLLYLRAKSIKQIHQLLASDISKRGKASLNIRKSLTNAVERIEQKDSNNIEQTLGDVQQMIHQALTELDSQLKTDEPDNLEGKSLNIALPYLSDYLHNKYNILIVSKAEIDEEKLSYELQADIYKMVYEALTSAIINGNAQSFTVHLQEFKNKIWLTVSDDESSFITFKSKIKFDMSMYYIRQIASKYSASVNTFDEHENGSQLVISIPLMSIS